MNIIPERGLCIKAGTHGVGVCHKNVHSSSGSGEQVGCVNTQTCDWGESCDFMGSECIVGSDSLTGVIVWWCGNEACDCNGCYINENSWAVEEWWIVDQWLSDMHLTPLTCNLSNLMFSDCVPDHTITMHYCTYHTIVCEVFHHISDAFLRYALHFLLQNTPCTLCSASCLHHITEELHGHYHMSFLLSFCHHLVMPHMWLGPRSSVNQLITLDHSQVMLLPSP